MCLAAHMVGMNLDEYVQPIVVSRTGTHEDAVTAAAQVSLRAYLCDPDDPRWLTWLAGAFTKTVRRAKPTQLAALRPQATVAVQQGQSVALGFPPCTYAELAPSIARLQVSGTELERMGWGGNDRMARLCLVVNESLGMSTGKTAAQAAHALFAWYLQADHVQRFWWVQVDMPLHITGATQAEFDMLVPQSEVVITDAGRTETAPGTATVLSLSLDTSDGPGSAPVRSGAANNKDYHPNGSR